MTVERVPVDWSAELRSTRSGSARAQTDRQCCNTPVGVIIARVPILDEKALDRVYEPDTFSRDDIKRIKLYSYRYTDTRYSSERTDLG